MSRGVTELVVLAQNGDSEAFGELYEMFYKEMFLYACSMTGNSITAEDAVSDAVVEAVKGLKNLRKPESFKGWLFKILNIACRKQFNQKISVAELEPESENRIAAKDEIAQTETGIQLEAALGRLKSEEREIVLLSIVNEYDSNEIAEMLGMPSSTVRSKLSRALKKLRKIMEIE